MTRGETIVANNRVLEVKCHEAATKLNLARHGVKGEKDILSKFIYSSVDLRGFKDRYPQSMYSSTPSRTPSLTLPRTPGLPDSFTPYPPSFSQRRALLCAQLLAFNAARGRRPDPTPYERTTRYEYGA